MAQDSTTVWIQAAAKSPPADCGGCEGSPVATACGDRALGEPCLTPRLEGDSGTLQCVLAALDAEAADAAGGIVTRRCVKSLRIADGEAELTVTFAPTCGRGKVLAEIAFATLRRLLPDTDVYVRHAV
jgi:hypothetical protein